MKKILNYDNTFWVYRLNLEFKKKINQYLNNINIKILLFGENFKKIIDIVNKTFFYTTNCCNSNLKLKFANSTLLSFFFL